MAHGTAPTDALNLDQMENRDRMVMAGVQKFFEAGKQYADAGDTATLRSANAHADAGDAATLRSANAYTDARVSAIVQPQF